MFALGGTISMAGRDGGAVVRLTGAELVAELETLTGGLEVVARDVRAVPSAELSFADMLELAAAADAAVRAGARGVVVSQGTDTLEETAFLLDSVWVGEAPLVMTGAMRNPTLPGADGPANLVAAVQTAAAPAALDRGVLVVFNDEIHAARHVRKTHSMSTATFASPDTGPIGHLVEGLPRFLARVPRTRPVTGVSAVGLEAVRVALHTVTFDDDACWLDRLGESHRGLVVAAFGVGHVPRRLAQVFGALAREMPVVLCSRTGAGPVFADTYGAPGSERDLRERGLIDGGFLHPYKARVLLRLLIASGAGSDEIERRFAEFG
jgi:L-asparaginase